MRYFLSFLQILFACFEESRLQTDEVVLKLLHLIEGIVMAQFGNYRVDFVALL